MRNCVALLTLDEARARVHKHNHIPNGTERTQHIKMKQKREWKCGEHTGKNMKGKREEGKNVNERIKRKLHKCPRARTPGGFTSFILPALDQHSATFLLSHAYED